MRAWLLYALWKGGEAGDDLIDIGPTHGARSGPHSAPDSDSGAVAAGRNLFRAATRGRVPRGRTAFGEKLRSLAAPPHGQQRRWSDWGPRSSCSAVVTKNNVVPSSRSGSKAHTRTRKRKEALSSAWIEGMAIPDAPESHSRLTLDGPLAPPRRPSHRRPRLDPGRRFPRQRGVRPGSTEY